MNDPIPSKKSDLPDTSWNPVIYSVIIYPGIGQWMQKRRATGVFFGAAFTVVILVLTVVITAYVKQIIPLFEQALAGSEVTVQQLPPLKSTLQPFTFMMVVYLANVIDVLWGRRKAIRALAQK